MSDNKRFYWLKLKKDFFKRHDVFIIEAMENGAEIVLVYIKMLVESIDHNGCLRYNADIPYNAKMLSAVFHIRLDVMELALKQLEDFEMIKTEPDGTIRMLKFEDFVGTDTEAAIKKRAQRALPTLKNGSKRLNGATVITPDGKAHHVDEKRYGGHGMQALDRAKGKCELCGSDEGVLIHHNNGYSSELDDLVVLCTSCHGKAHSGKGKGHVNIERPPYVHQLSTPCPVTVGQMSTQSIDIREQIIENRDKSIERESNTLSHFEPPTVEEVYLYCQGRHNGIDAQRFVDYYTARGWKNITDWKAQIRVWENREDRKDIDL